ncbi:unnamed protein product [Rhizophagus irregularis]|nr:unnamed protein product [Rhizophagus irregularis]
MIPFNENKNDQDRQNNLNELEQNRKLIYQESWVLKLECLQCYERFERFERWKKKLANNHSVKAEKDERNGKKIKGENKNEKANVNVLWVKKVKNTKKKKNKDEIKEKMEEWMIERMEDNEWLREWMDGVVG